jgi:hypothetical protein
LVNKISQSNVGAPWLESPSGLTDPQGAAAFEIALDLIGSSAGRATAVFPLDIAAERLTPLPTPNTFISRPDAVSRGRADILQVLPWVRVSGGLGPGESQGGLAARLRQLCGVNAAVDGNLPRLLERLGSGGFGQTGQGPSLTPVVLVTRPDDGGSSIRNFYRPMALYDRRQDNAGLPDGKASAALQLLGPGMSVYVSAHDGGLVASLQTARTVSRQTQGSDALAMLRFAQDASGGNGLTVSEAGGAAIRLPAPLAERLMGFLSSTN